MSHISGSKMRIQEWFSPLERAHNLLKIGHFPLRSPNLVLGHKYWEDPVVYKKNMTQFAKYDTK